ncbi:MAG: 50S ribosomal protein L15 [Leptospiraceae bacterium]|nr:50S ribosomal protein L15 [Leptospiraceae bacterium]
MSNKSSNRIKPSTAFGAARKSKKVETNSSNLIPIPKGAKKERKRIGQGPGSGMGKTSTRGQKGQKARASSMRRGFEGGQMPLHRRMPKRGFTNIFHVEYQPVNLGDLSRYNLSGSVTPEILAEKGLIKDASKLIKVLGTGEIKSSVTITADACSKAALEKLQKQGGNFTVRVNAKPETVAK